MEPQEQVTALELPDRVECLEGQTEAGAIQTDLTLRWNTSVFILASIIGSATGDPRAGCLLPLRAEGADDVGLLEDARRLGMAGTVEAAQGARPRGCGRGRQDPFHLGDPFALPQAGQVDRGALALALPEGISTGDFTEALAALLGPDAPGLSASTNHALEGCLARRAGALGKA